MPGSIPGMTCCRAARVSSWATALTRGQMVRVPTSLDGELLGLPALVGAPGPGAGPGVVV